MLKVYTASAGSGKTYILVEEYLLMLFKTLMKYSTTTLPLDVSPHEHILAVTFTKKATAEMKGRIVDELYHLSKDPTTSAHISVLQKALALSPTDIGTRAQMLLHHLLQDYSHFAVSTIDSFFQRVVRSFARELNLCVTYTISLDEDEIINQAVQAVLKEINKEPILRTVLQDIISKNISEEKSWNPTTTLTTFAKELSKESLKRHLPQVPPLGELERNVRSLREVEDYKDSLQDINYLILITAIYERIQVANKEQRRLPISEVNNLLQRIIDDSDTPFIYEKIGTRFQYYMIDEFQDTSVMQWENFRPLIDNALGFNTDNLIVGDVKQSIYRFRNSDWHLLHTQLQSDFPQAKRIPMGVNYRSAQRIVEGNNRLFVELPPFVGVGQDVYTTQGVSQTPNKSLEGYYSVEVIDNGSRKEDFEVEAIKRLLTTLSDLKGRYEGHMNHVAILVSKNNEIQLLTRVLTENGYLVNSTEGTLINAHPAINILVAVLAYNQERPLENKHSIHETLLLHLLHTDTFSAEQKKIFTTAKKYPLYEQVHYLIKVLQLDQLPQASTYLTTFLDILFEFLQTHTSDIWAFLNYWELKKEKTYIPAVESEDAIEITTIHKSKGLEWDVVILPFVTWTWKKNGDAIPIVWCEIPSQYGVPVIPIKYKSTYEGPFKQVIDTETDNIRMDTLNLTYVAFTRPKKELYAFVQAYTLKKDGEISHTGDNIGKYIARVYNNISEVHGTKTRFEADKEVTPHSTTEPITMYFDDLHDRLRMRRRNIDATTQGTLMHEWLSRIKHLDEAPQALQAMVQEGYILPADCERMNAEMQTFQHLIQDKDWFSEKYTIYTEVDILTPQGSTYRPDRVLMDGNHVIVIDYKFGQIKAEHKAQVKNYMHLFEQMGKSTEGYLVYVEEEKIVSV